MGLFTKSFVSRIQSLEDRIEHEKIDENITFQFSQKVRAIEDEDVECIRILKKMAKAGHLSESAKKALMNQFLFLLYRLEKLRKLRNVSKDDVKQLEEIKAEMEAFVMEELTSEKIGIELKKPIYHGTGIFGIQRFETGYALCDKFGAFDYMGAETLGSALYCTDNKRMAINYAFLRYNNYQRDKQLVREFSSSLRPTVYTLTLPEGKRYLADFTDPRKIRAIYRDLKDFCSEELRKNPKMPLYHRVGNFIQFLDFVIKNKALFSGGIRGFLVESKPLGGSEKVIYQINKFLKERGYTGARTVEGGEVSGSVYPWVPALSYGIFEPKDLQIVAMESYKLVNGRVVKL